MRPVLVVLLCLLFSARASAFCRTTVCDTQSAEPCAIDDNGCTAVSDDNPAVSWPSGCVSYVVQRGNPDSAVTIDELESTVASAFDLWTEAACEGGDTPALFAQSRGDVACDVPEFNCADEDRKHNFNAVMFQPETWTHDRGAFALTTVTVNLKNGEILDADIEINDVRFDFGLTPESGATNLRAVISHEVGHFLGLNHSPFNEAIMFARYSNAQFIDPVLTDDDIAGMCDIFGADDEDPECEVLDPPEDDECRGGTPCPKRRRVEEGCSCRVGAAPPGWGYAATLLAAYWVRRRRRAATWRRGRIVAAFRNVFRSTP